MELGGVLHENRRRVVIRIDGDRVQRDGSTDSRAEQGFAQRESRRLERARELAVGIDEVDRDDLAFDQVIVEVDTVTLLRDQGDVWYAVSSRPRALRITHGPESP